MRTYACICMCLSFEGVSKSVSDGREARHLIDIKGKKGDLLREGAGPCWKEGGRGSSEKKEAKTALLSQVPSHSSLWCCSENLLILSSDTAPSTKSLKMNAFPKLTLKKLI